MRKIRKLINEVRYGELLGTHKLAPSVTELLPDLMLAQQLAASLEEIIHNVHVYPTLSEAIK